MEKKHIEIIGARQNNLKNISLKLPRNKFIVVTGVSGSGKSSLAFDTLFAEGQRRYIESLSAYARQFLGKIKKPEVDNIKGLPPAISIEQKVNTANPRSTVGTSSEIYDYLKLLFARIGKTISPVSGKEVKRHTITDVVDFLLSFTEGTKAFILAPLQLSYDALQEKLDLYEQEGFLRFELIINGQAVLFTIAQLREKAEEVKGFEQVRLVVDRVKVRHDDQFKNRVADSVNTAFFEGAGYCLVKVIESNQTIEEEFSNRFEADGLEFEEPTVEMFNFNSPVGACQTCNGFGTTIAIDEDLVIPDKNLSVYQDAVACWRGPKLQYYKNLLIKNAHKFDFPVHKPYRDLTKEQRELLWNGNSYFTGINEFFAMLEKEQHKVQNRVMLARYRGKTICPVCKGTRLRSDSAYVKIKGKSIQDLVLMEIKELLPWFEQLQLSAYEKQVAGRLLEEIRNRLMYLNHIGLGYLTLNRASNTLSGGETQRINLATALGSSLVGSLYILDEPTVGLHPRDTQRLTKVLRSLQELGNTVLVVEHDETVMREADYIVDMGPGAGVFGGEVVFAGSPDELENSNTLTAQYLTGRRIIAVSEKRRKPSAYKGFIKLTDVYQNNLKYVDVDFPLHLFTVVTGVSGSGKSSLVVDVLYPALAYRLGIYTRAQGKYGSLSGDLEKIKAVELVDQNPIGRSARSNPVTYIKAYDDIRKLYALQPAAKVQGFKQSHFSFNVQGGRCEVCQGEGVITIEMQFMPDVTLVCDACHGRRFKDDVLEVYYRGKNIYDVLEMTVDEAVEFFVPSDDKKFSTLERNIVAKLTVLQKVGLGYLKLGQPSSTLSGGESQRLKLASFLLNEAKDKHTVFIFDEPTTGLHFEDVRKLLKALNELVDRGNTVIVIEHNTDVIKSADWVIDLGPEGGYQGGEVVFCGTPSELLNCKRSVTAKAINYLLE